jgi:hypothetical protein
MPKLTLLRLLSSKFEVLGSKFSYEGLISMIYNIKAGIFCPIAFASPTVALAKEGQRAQISPSCGLIMISSTTLRPDRAWAA